MDNLIKLKNTKVKVKKFQSTKGLFCSLLFVLLSLLGCKSTENAVSSSKLSKKSAFEIIQAHNDVAVNFETYTSKLRLSYDDGKKVLNPTATLRLEKDKQLWLSFKALGFTVAKAYITPNEVQFYEKLGKRFYKGNFSALSQFLGTTVSFKSLQDLLMGQSMLDLNNNKLVAKKNVKGAITISPKKPSKKYDYTISLNQLNYKVASYFISQKEKNRALHVIYDNYQKIEENILPESISIDAKTESKTRKLDVEFRKVSLNNALTFPFEIPSGYKPFRF